MLGFEWAFLFAANMQLNRAPLTSPFFFKMPSSVPFRQRVWFNLRSRILLLTLIMSMIMLALKGSVS